MREAIFSELFRRGVGTYHTYRIPALVVTVRGTVLAFCEGRRDSSHDDAPIDLLLRRSNDGGTTWSDPQVVVSDGDRTCGNPCPVIDARTGTVLLPFCKDNQQIFVTRSDDDGVSWSEPVEITSVAKDPSWSYVGTGPGHGIQLSSGRLLIPSWADESPGPVTWRDPVPNWGKVQSSYAFFSDDGGETWQRGAKMTHDASDECEAAEVDGRVYMTLRSRHSRKQRGYAWSDDGGDSWSPVAFDETLPELSCQGSIVCLDGVIFMANPASTTSRAELTVRRSDDGSRTWAVSQVLHAGSAAYSDLAINSDGEILCFFEADDYTQLLLARFDSDCQF